MNVLIVYAHRLKIYLGAYTWLLNGADAIAFTDDVGVRSWKLREKVCPFHVYGGRCTCACQGRARLLACAQRRPAERG
jgi:acetate kinase